MQSNRLEHVPTAQSTANIIASQTDEVVVHPHALLRARERRSPIKFALSAVRRQQASLRAACPTAGMRAAIDYREGLAVVMRKPTGHLQIRTILEKWMAVDNLPLILDEGAPSHPSRASRPDERTLYPLSDLIGGRDLQALQLGLSRTDSEEVATP